MSDEVKVLHQWEITGDRTARVWTKDGKLGFTIAGHSTHHTEEIDLGWLHSAASSFVAAAEVARLASLLDRDRGHDPSCERDEIGPQHVTIRKDDLDALREAAKAMLDKLPLCEEALSGLYTLAYVHGMPYSGPTYEAERDALRAALARIAKPEAE